jgi:transposase-like protein
MAKREFTPEEREEVFRDWATEKYGNLTQLAEAYGIAHEKTIEKWVERYEWRDKRADYLDDAFVGEKNRGDVIHEANQLHLQGWRMLQAHALNLLKPRKDKNGKMMLCGPETLQKIASTLERSQRGQRLAIGADLARNEDRSKRIRVTIGDEKPDGNSGLKVLAKEVLDQHERAEEEDKKASSG